MHNLAFRHQPRRSKTTPIGLLLLLIALLWWLQIRSEKPAAASSGHATANPMASMSYPSPVTATASDAWPSTEWAGPLNVAATQQPQTPFPMTGSLMNVPSGVGIVPPVIVPPVIPVIPAPHAGKAVAAQKPAPKPSAGPTRSIVARPAAPAGSPKPAAPDIGKLVANNTGRVPSPGSASPRSAVAAKSPKPAAPGVGNVAANNTGRLPSPRPTPPRYSNARRSNGTGTRMPDSFFMWGPSFSMGGGFTGGHFGGGHMGGGFHGGMGGGHMGGHMGGGHHR